MEIFTEHTENIQPEKHEYSVNILSITCKINIDQHDCLVIQSTVEYRIRPTHPKRPAIIGGRLNSGLFALKESNLALVTNDGPVSGRQGLALSRI